MDIFDQAQEAAERFNQQALDLHKSTRKAPGPGSKKCLECGRIIPKKRREAEPGCELCVDCKAAAEKGC